MKLASEEDGMLAEINVTPLVDVMLVLLIIFMVTAPLIQQGLAVSLPKSEAAKALPREEKDIVLTIYENQKLLLDVYKVDVKTLKPKLTELFRNRRERKVFIRADAKVPYGFVIDIMGKVRAAGIERIGMITEPSVQVR